MSDEDDRDGSGTVAVHGRTKERGVERAKSRDAIPTPIVVSSTFAFRDTAELCQFFDGNLERDEYGRYGSPSVRSVEAVLGALDGAQDCAVFSSGMAAITTALLALLKSGDHVVLTSDCYRRTRQFVTGTLARLGIESSVVDPSDMRALEAAIARSKTRVVLTEVPSNPYLRVPDLAAYAGACKAVRGVKLVVDATFATPINLKPLERGADLVLHSGTKYLGGHNDVIAGSVAGSASVVSLVRDMRGVLGGVLDPHAAYLLERGVKTLALRVARQNATALRLAKAIEAHRAVERVYYPMLPSHPDFEIARRTLGGGGGVVSFVVRGDLEGARTFVDGLRIPAIAPSLGGVESLVEQPALMSFYELSTKQREAIGIKNGLVRLSVGVEDVEDLERDIVASLNRL
jgi:cystathionine gamma-synthase